MSDIENPKRILSELEVQTQMERLPEYIVAQGIPPRLLMHALRYGIIRLGWTVKNYLQVAVKTGGFENVAIWGTQGSGKSNRMLQHGFWIYGDWDIVLKSVVFKPDDVVKKLQSIPHGRRMPCLLWDDVGVFFPSLSWRTNVEMYQSIDSAWAAIRTKCNVVSLTIPLIDRLGKCLKDNLTIEEYVSPNQSVINERYVRLPGIKNRVETNFRKIMIEPIVQFDMYKCVPRDVFREYWDMRLALTDQALDQLAKVVGLESQVEGYITVLDAIEELEQMGVIRSPRYLTQLGVEGAFRKKRVDGLLWINREDFDRIKTHFLKETQQKDTTEGSK